MDFANICIGCMKSKEQGQSVCPHCGFDERTYTAPSYVLPPYTILNGKFLVGRVLGMGGFGITYVAMDLTLEHRVAIKEYFIRNVMYRNATESSKVTVVHTNIPEEKIYHISCEKFENEAKTLASLSDLPGIVHILEFFTEYNTAYIVMEYLSGETLKEYVKEKGGKLSLEETREKLNPVMTSLQYVHERNIIHRDISPDNMKVLDEGPMKGHVKLFDFGGAGREVRSEEDPRSAIVLKKEGYTPMEQIAGSSNQGAWTDVYAMAATIYYCICGQAPLSVSARVADPSDFKRPSQLGIPITKKVEEVLLKGMTIQSGDRYQTMKEFQDALEKAGWGLTRKRTMKVWPFMAAGGVAACIGIGLIVNQVHNSARKEDNILEANAGKLIDTEKETVTEQVKAQTETLEIVKTEDVTETMKESAEDSLKKGEWGELTQWISLRSQTTYGGKVIGRYKKGTKVKILEKNDGWYKVYILGELGYVPVNTVISSVQEEKKETEKVTEAVEETAEELYKLGYTYTYGGAKDYQKALEYYEQAANLGSSYAMNGLGLMYMKGEGVEQDLEKAREYFERAAELGHVGAKNNLKVLAEKLFQLGYKYRYGSQKDYQKALEYYEQAANLGNSKAMYGLGRMYMNGDEVDQDLEKAREYFEEAAELGHVGAKSKLKVLDAMEEEPETEETTETVEETAEELYKLGYKYRHGTQKDYQKALKYYEQAATLGNSKAMNSLGHMYMNGEGVEQDLEKAREYFERAAELGHVGAKNNLKVLAEKLLQLGYKYRYGSQKDYQKALEYYEQAANLGSSYAMNVLGMMYKNGEGVEQDLEKAREYFEQAVELGNPAAKYNLQALDAMEEEPETEETTETVEETAEELYKLGYTYTYGSQKDYQKALEYYEQAATLGNSYAMNGLGLMYMKGEGAEQDLEKAREYFERAAELGNAVAEYWLHTLDERTEDEELLELGYKYRHGTQKDYQKALKYYEQAATLGNSKAMNSLGHMYMNGEGVEQDLEKAREYFERAAELGEVSGWYNLQALDAMEEEPQTEKILDDMDEELKSKRQILGWIFKF